MPEIGLKVRGTVYRGWKSITLTRGIKALAGSFEVSVTEKWARLAQPWPIFEEDEVSVTLEGETVITGWVDRRRVKLGPQEHSLTISGRDRAGALVDCSAILPHASGKGRKWELAGVPLEKIAKELAAPFGVAVAVDAQLVFPPPPKKFAVNPGDTAFEVLERGCRLAGVLAVSDGDGGIVLMRPGADRCVTDLVEGVNVLDWDGDFDVSGRFRTYIVQGQHPGDNEYFGADVATVEGQATDESVKRAERVLLVRPEGAVTVASAKQRAAWEAITRASRGDSVTAVVQGWTQGDGSLWPINAGVNVRSPSLRLDGSMLIVEATHSLSEAGTTTTLSLARPDAYLPEPKIQKGSGVWKELAKGV